jgi:hypothetical protein
VRESFLVCRRERVVKWGSCCRLVPGVPGFRGWPRRRPDRGHDEVPRWEDGLPTARFGVPATRVFSLHVVQAGSARAAEAAGPAPTAFNRAGEKHRRPGESCPGFGPRLVLNVKAGSLSPTSGRKVKGAPAAVRADRCAGQAASDWQVAPEATAASQLVPCTTME